MSANAGSRPGYVGPRSRRCQAHASVLVQAYESRAAEVTRVSKVYAYAAGAEVQEGEHDYAKLVRALDVLIERKDWAA